MTCQIASSQKPGSGLRKAAQEEIASAINLIHSSGKPEAVLHEVRKQLKKLRALVRLGFGKAANRSQTDLIFLLQKAGRRIARVRDLQVQISTLQKLVEDSGTTGMANLCRDIKARLSRRLFRFNIRRLCRETALELKTASHLLETWPSDELTHAGIRHAWNTSHRKSSKQMKRVLAKPETENLHEWRKRIKTWGYQTRFLSSGRTNKMDQLASLLEKLGEYLGDDHDLSLIEQTLEKIESPAKKKLQLHLQKRRTRLQNKALKLGLKLPA